MPVLPSGPAEKIGERSVDRAAGMIGAIPGKLVPGKSRQREWLQWKHPRRGGEIFEPV